ncbi:hypothetical protein, partial [Streptomyces sp. NPDC059552]|uniref:hypothetical protein n=1 Tax=Streptomyces sp. NPDC059552 TaxID=3346862 RepID=UPI00367FFD45
MLIAFLLFVILGVIVTTAPGALLGYGCVAGRRRQSAGPRVRAVGVVGRAGGADVRHPPRGWEQ